MSSYGIFKNKKGKTLVFYPCPKNANSSTKLFLAKHMGLENNFVFVGDRIPRYKQKNSDFKKKNLINFLPTKQPFEKTISDYKCCIVRDPIKRFISSYKNRILYHRDKDFNNYSIDRILEELENKNFKNLHFLPQSYFLGNDLNYFDFFCNVNQIIFFKDYINNFFEKNINFPQIQTGGSEFSVTISKNQINKIKKIYLSDYNLINLAT